MRHPVHHRLASISQSFVASYCYLFILCLILPSSVVAQGADEQTCYWADGRPVTSTNTVTLVPCSNNGTSSCCRPGDACLKNGLCGSGADGHTYRGACTDKNWGNEDLCPTKCTQYNPRALSIVFPCPANAEGQWKWWCGNTNGGRICDGRDSEYWDWVPGPIDHIATSAANEAPTVSTSLLPTSTSLLPTSRPSSETSPNSPGQGDNSAGTAPPDLSDMVKTSTPIAVGLGVGIPLLIIAAFATVLYFRERKAREKAERLHAATLGMGPQELMDLAKYKMDGTHGRVEMDWQTPRRHELQGRTVGEMRA